MPITYAEREIAFQKLLGEKPPPGTILTSEDGEPVPVYVEAHPDTGGRVVYTNALIDYDCTGWYLSRQTTGLKVLVLPRSQKTLIDRNGGSTERLTVLRLRVVRHNQKGTALIAEVVNGNTSDSESP